MTIVDLPAGSSSLYQDAAGTRTVVLYRTVDAETEHRVMAWAAAEGYQFLLWPDDRSGPPTGIGTRIAMRGRGP